MNSLHATNATLVKGCKSIGNLIFFLTNLYEKCGSEGTKAVLDAIKNSKHLLPGKLGVYTILNGEQILLVELPWNVSAQTIHADMENYSTK